MMNYSPDPSNMKYGQIAGNRHINALIYHCFGYLCEEDEQKFVRKFREQPPDSDQIMHTFRELVLGAYLSSSGFKVRHDYAVDSQTPDWCILDEKPAVIGIVELTNFHIDKATENEIEEQLQARGIAWYWRDENKDNADRLYHCIWHKAQVYKVLLEKLRVPYIIALSPESQAAIDFKEEVCPCLFEEKTGLFEMYSEVSGVLYFEERPRGQYSFYYALNPNALRVLPIGIFPPDVAG
jgi:hypothetical protein